jgi:hypothetical protein
MSLKVYAYRRASPDAELEFLIRLPAPPANEAVGAEGSRRGFWSHDALVRRGMSVLPSLREADVYADGPELDALEREITAILAELDEIARETQSDPVWVRFRAENVLAAIQLAREVEDGIGGVYIG